MTFATIYFGRWQAVSIHTLFVDITNRKEGKESYDMLEPPVIHNQVWSKRKNANPSGKALTYKTRYY
jgi:hypothetical protein